MSASGDQSLTGVWDGQFSYPRLFGPTQFTAVLLEFGTSLSGTTHETVEDGPSKGQSLTATINGERTGAQVRFTKIYDPSGRRQRRPVRYEGVLNAEATEIEGSWAIPGNWTGRFIMRRPPRAKASAKAGRVRAVEVE